MKIEILSIAMGDIQFGQRFYEQQQEGLGVYFLDSLFSDMERQKGPGSEYSQQLNPSVFSAPL